MRTAALVVVVAAAILTVAVAEAWAAAPAEGALIGAVLGQPEPIAHPGAKPDLVPPGGPDRRPVEQRLAALEQAVARLYALALRAAQETKDAELQRLVDQSLTDRRAMIQEELNRLTAFEAVVQAVRSGDKNAVETAREQLKAATEKLHAAGKKVAEDVRAVAQRLRELRPEIMEGMEERPAGMRPGEFRRRGPGAPPAGDAPPALD